MTAKGRHWYTALYVQVLIAVVLGALVGWLFPAFATNDWVEFLGRGFVKLVKMAIAPLIFCTVVSGIAHIQEASSVGRVGLKALVYFEAVSTLALVVGLTVGSVWRPGASFPDITLTPEQAAQAKCYADAARQIRPVDFILHIIPDSIVGAFVSSPDAGLCKAGSSRSATSSRCCSLPSCSALRSSIWASARRGSGASWTISPMRCSPSSASS